MSRPIGAGCSSVWEVRLVRIQMLGGRLEMRGSIGDQVMGEEGMREGWGICMRV